MLLGFSVRAGAMVVIELEVGSGLEMHVGTKSLSTKRLGFEISGSRCLMVLVIKAHAALLARRPLA